MLARYVAGLAFLAGTITTWIPFRSDIYPYTIQQPSSYRHIVIVDTAKHKVDYFFPSLGSSVTNVNIYADGTYIRPRAYLRSIGGSNVHRSGWLRVMGHRYPLTCANFTGIRSRWTIEQIDFRARGRVWHLTASYDHRFRNQRGLMMHMLRTFRAR